MSASGSLTSIISRCNLDEMCRLAMTSPPGAFVEVGVYKGGSALELYKIALVQARDLHLFDTFGGMPISDLYWDHHKVGEFADVDLSEIRAAMPCARFHIGVFPQTMPQAMAPVAFVHCDCDQYQSYRDVIDIFWPRLVPGGRILFDDYPYLAGAKRAVEETFSPVQILPTGAGRNYVEKPL